MIVLEEAEIDKIIFYSTTRLLLRSQTDALS